MYVIFQPKDNLYSKEPITAARPVMPSATDNSSEHHVREGKCFGRFTANKFFNFKACSVKIHHKKTIISILLCGYIYWKVLINGNQFENTDHYWMPNLGSKKEHTKDWDYTIAVLLSL